MEVPRYNQKWWKGYCILEEGKLIFRPWTMRQMGEFQLET
jgi:hypothetical protein